jgi:hypothetical protein
MFLLTKDLSAMMQTLAAQGKDRKTKTTSLISDCNKIVSDAKHNSPIRCV